jgi:hypothetical protein
VLWQTFHQLPFELPQLLIAANIGTVRHAGLQPRGLGFEARARRQGPGLGGKAPGRSCSATHACRPCRPCRRQLAVMIPFVLRLRVGWASF